MTPAAAEGQVDVRGDWLTAAHLSNFQLYVRAVISAKAVTPFFEVQTIIVSVSNFEE